MHSRKLEIRVNGTLAAVTEWESLRVWHYTDQKIREKVNFSMRRHPFVRDILQLKKGHGLLGWISVRKLVSKDYFVSCQQDFFSLKWMPQRFTMSFLCWTNIKLKWTLPYKEISFFTLIFLFRDCDALKVPYSFPTASVPFTQIFSFLWCILHL